MGGINTCICCYYSFWVHCIFTRYFR